MIGLTYVAVLGVLLWLGSGHYRFELVTWATGLHVGYALVVLARRRVGQARDQWLQGGLTLVCVLFTLLMSVNPQLGNPRDGAPRETLSHLLVVLPLLASMLAVLLSLPQRLGTRVAWYILLGSLAIGLVWARLLTLEVSPHPHIDVFTGSQQAVSYLLHGQTPYGGHYTDIYHGHFGYPAGYPYWPGWLIWSLLGQLWGGPAGDVRFSLLLAELLAAGTLAGLARQLGLGGRTALLAAVTWLAFPVALFTLEQSWVDPVLCAALGGATWAIAARRYWVAGALLGWAGATKQYAFIAVLLAWLGVLRTGGWRAAARTAVAGSAVGVALVAPFAAADWVAFRHMTIDVVGALRPRLDAMTLTSLLADKLEYTGARLEGLYGFASRLSWIIVAALAAWTALIRRPGRLEWLGAACAAYGVFFLLASQAFCNYYALLAFLVLTWSLSGCADVQSSSVAGALVAPEPPQPAGPRP